MSWKEIEKDLLERFGEEFSEWRWTRVKRIPVRLRAGALAAAARFLSGNGQVRFISATALETPSGHIDVWYHFDFFQTSQVLSVRVTVRPDDLSLPSLTAFWPNAAWSEQEASRSFGIRFHLTWGDHRPSGRPKEKRG
jgi:NADH:ubiquinone oxidoreductase subunit C